MLPERNHIAREIHDSLGYILTAQNIQLQTAVKLWQHDLDRACSFLQQAQQLAASAMQEVRRSVPAPKRNLPVISVLGGDPPNFGGQGGEAETFEDRCSREWCTSWSIEAG